MKLLFLIAVVATALNFDVGLSHAQGVNIYTSPKRASPVPKEFFGLIIHRAHTNTNWPALPFGSWRLWDSYLKWSDIQPVQGTWKFDAFDRQVALGEENTKELIYTLGQTPAWASVLGNEKHAWGYGAGGMPKDIAYWGKYVEAVVGRYKGRIHGYEVWNEPKYSELGRCKGAIFFCGTPQELVALTQTAHEIVKRVDPSALLTTPGFTGGLEGVKQLDAYLSAGGAKFVEVISFHFYELQPEQSWKTVAALRAVMSKHGLSHLPIWNTEVGYLIQNQDRTVQREHDAGAFSVVFSPAEAAARLARTMIVSASGGIDRMYWYAWDSKRMGLIGSNDNIPHATSIAYRVTRRWLIGSTVNCENQSTNGLWQCQLTRGNRTALLVWSDQTGPAGFTLSKGAPQSIEDLSEGRKTLNGGTRLEWNGDPILITDTAKPWFV